MAIGRTIAGQSDTHSQGFVDMNAAPPEATA
jgi:hypothetical protein